MCNDMKSWPTTLRHIHLTDCVHMRLKLGESPKSRILTKLGWIDLLMNVIDHALRFCYGSTLTVATAHPKSDFY